MTARYYLPPLTNTSQVRLVYSGRPKLHFQHTALFPRARAQFYSAIGSDTRRALAYEINRMHAICVGSSAGRSDERV